MKTCLALILFLATSFSAVAEDKTFLYGDYYYGMSREELLKTGPAQCDDYPDGRTICNRQRVNFGAFEWTQFFEFDKAGLFCVAFGQPLSMKAINAAMAWFQDEDYVPVNAKAGSESANFLLLYDKKGNQEFAKENENFVNNLPRVCLHYKNNAIKAIYTPPW